MPWGDREIADSIALVRFRRCVSHRFGYLLDGHEAAGVDKKSGGLVLRFAIGLLERE